MKIGYIYLYGEEWEEWKKHNKPLTDIIQELKDFDCDKIYMDVFIEEYGFPEIERIDMKELLIIILASQEEDKLLMRGMVAGEMSDQEFQTIIKKEVKRIDNRHNRQI